jgi:uncharacterized protein with GYD domain
MKYAAFDLEIAEPMESEYAGQHISCAAVYTKNGVQYFSGKPYMKPFEVGMMIGELVKLTHKGYSILTWNGLSFDFKVLAAQSQLFDVVKMLAFQHYDPMFQVLCVKGFPIGLDKACVGADIQGKKHVVSLKNGEVLTEMGGKRAPELWAVGEYEAVLEYLHDDVSQLWELAKRIENQGMIRWTSNSGRFNSFAVPKLLTVKECLAIPLPDTSWMTSHISRESMYEWMLPKKEEA